MGNIQNFKMRNNDESSTPIPNSERSHLNLVPVEEFIFHGLFEDSTNGLCLNNVYIPEEIILNILSYIPSKDILNLTLVCKKWCNIIKSNSFWIHKYNSCPNQAKNLPWYVYYCYFTTDNFTNLIRNGNGQKQFQDWKIARNYGDKFKVEVTPVGSDPLPDNVLEFYGYSSCFVTSYYECSKYQTISLLKKRLLQYIIKKYKPHIYASEWVAGRFDCGCRYRFGVSGYYQDPNNTESQTDQSMLEVPNHNEITNALFYPKKELIVQQWEGKTWQKLEILIDDYPTSLNLLVFEHEGSDTQFWKGHYGSKMAGGVLKFVFDSIQPTHEK